MKLSELLNISPPRGGVILGKWNGSYSINKYTNYKLSSVKKLNKMKKKHEHITMEAIEAIGGDFNKGCISVRDN